MFDIGWTEMLVIAVVMIVVVGPKDLPRMLRTFGKMTTKVRGMAGDFQKQFNDALKEAELDDVKKSVDSLRSLNPAAEIKKQLNPFEKAAADVRAGLDNAMKPKLSTSSEPASPVVHEAEPLKNGAAMNGVAAPAAMPATPPPGLMATEPSASATLKPVGPAEMPSPVPPPALAVAKPMPARKAAAAAKPAKAAAPSAKAAAKPVKAASAVAVSRASPASGAAAKPAVAKRSPRKST